MTTKTKENDTIVVDASSSTSSTTQQQEQLPPLPPTNSSPANPKPPHSYNIYHSQSSQNQSKHVRFSPNTSTALISTTASPDRRKKRIDRSMEFVLTLPRTDAFMSIDTTVSAPGVTQIPLNWCSNHLELSKLDSAVYKLDISLDLNVDLHKFLGISTTSLYFNYLNYIYPAPFQPNNLDLKNKFDTFKKQYLETFRYNQALPGFQQQNWIRCRDSCRKLFAEFSDYNQNYILQMLTYVSNPFANKLNQVRSLSSVSTSSQANSSDISMPPSVSASNAKKSAVSQPPADSVTSPAAPPPIINLMPPKLASIPSSTAPTASSSLAPSDLVSKSTTSLNPASDAAFAQQIQSIINSNSMPPTLHNSMQSQRAGMIKTPLLGSAAPELRFPAPVDTSLGGNLSEANYNEINAALQQFGRQLDPFKTEQSGATSTPNFSGNSYVLHSFIFLLYLFSFCIHFMYDLHNFSFIFYFIFFLLHVGWSLFAFL